MKTTIKLLLCQLLSAGLACVCGQSAQAQQLLFSEGFNYTPGNGLANQVNPGNNTAWMNGNTAELQIGGSQLTYPGLQLLPGYELAYTSSGSSSASYNTYTAITTGSVFYSFLIDCTSLPTANEYISALNPGTTTPNGSGDALSMYVGSSGNGWKMGIRTPGGNTGANYSGMLALNTTYLVVGQLTLGSSTIANLYVDPTPGAAQPGTPTATISGTTGVSSVDDIGFKIQSTTATGNFDIGNVLVATDWADVTPAAVPEPNTFALLGAGTIVWRAARRRLQSRF